MTAKTPVIATPAACVRAGYKIELPVKVDGKEILSRGEVFGIRRVGSNTIEITLMHAKTGSLFVNTVPADFTVGIASPAIVSEPTDALSKALMEHLLQLMKDNMGEFINMPIVD